MTHIQQTKHVQLASLPAFDTLLFANRIPAVWDVGSQAESRLIAKSQVNEAIGGQYAQRAQRLGGQSDLMRTRFAGCYCSQTLVGPTVFFKKRTSVDLEVLM